MKKIAVLVCHGIGQQKKDYAQELQKGIIKELKKRNINTENVFFESVLWAPILDTMQNRLNDNLKHSQINLKHSYLREIFLTHASDAIIYQPIANAKNYYDEIHAEVAKSLSKLASRCDEETFLIVAAHSLGSVLMSNFMWDMFKDTKKIITTEKIRKELTPKAWKLLDNLCFFITFGSPMYIWANRFEEPKPLIVPPNAFRSKYQNFGAWYNIVEPNDIISYPLQILNTEFNEAVIDIELELSDLLTGWNPASHIAYWHDRRFHRFFADKIKSIFDLNLLK